MEAQATASNVLSKTFARPPRVVQVHDKTSKASTHAATSDMHPREGEYESVSKRHDTTKYESLRCCWLQLARSVVDDDDAEAEADSDADASAAVQFCV